VNYQDIIGDIPEKLERKILDTLHYHVGRDSAIKKRVLMAQLTRLGFRTNERQIRAIVNKLRKEGNLICSAAAEDGGYYLASNLAEFNEFIERELGAKIADMSQTISAMKRAAHERFGNTVQMGLGI